MTKKYVLNTRPLDQKTRVHQAFESCGFGVFDLPCLCIVSAPVDDQLLQKMYGVSTDEAVIFTSQYAVRHAFAILPQWRIDEHCQIIAVGSKTAEVLEQHVSGHIWVPAEQNANGVIDLLKGMNHQKSVTLVTAPGGRKVIERYVLEQNLAFQQIDVYQRQKADWSDELLQALSTCQSLVVMATSVSTLQHLSNGLPEQLWRQLLNRPVLCASLRIATHAQTLGFNQCINACSADPGVMAATLSDYYA